MWDKIRRFFAPPQVGADRDIAHAAGLLNTILWVIFAANLLGTVVMIFLEPAEAFLDSIVGLVLVFALLGLRAALFRGHVRVIAWLLTLLLWVTVAYLTTVSGGIHGMAAMAYYLVIVAAGVLLGANATIIVGGLCILSGVLVFFLEKMGVVVGMELHPVSGVDLTTFGLMMALVVVLFQMSLRDLEGWSLRMRQSEEALAERNQDLQASREAQGAYTRAVERRSAYLEATTRVTWDTALTLELATLWERLVTSIRTEFSFYYVAIFLLDETRRQLVFQAGSGETAPQSPTRHYRLELSALSDLELVVRRAEARICHAWRDEPLIPMAVDFFNDPDLPEVRTILWLPLRQVQSDEVLGVLGLYSREADAFDIQDTLVLQALADQSAMLINQANLFAELQESLQLAERASGRATRESWQHWLRAEAGRTYRYTGKATDALAEMPTLPELLLPLQVRGQVLGQIVAHKSGGAWTTEENAMLETLMTQLEQALDSARLHEVTQRRAMREQLTREITDHIRSSLTVEEAMRRAVQEVARVLGATETVGRIGAERTLFPTEETQDHE